MEFYNLFMEKTNIAFAILKPFARIHNVGEGFEVYTLQKYKYPQG